MEDLEGHKLENSSPFLINILTGVKIKHKPGTTKSNVGKTVFFFLNNSNKDEDNKLIAFLHPIHTS